MGRFAREFSIAATLGVLLLVLAFAAPDFFNPAPLRSLLTHEAPTLVVACGMALVIISRQIDISVGSQFAVCGVCAGLLAAKLPLPVCGFASVGIGMGLGAINGALVSGLGLPSIVVTLGTMVVWREGLRLAQQGQFISLPTGFQWFGLGQTAGQTTLLVGSVVLLVVLAWMSRNLSAGRFIYAVGSDAEAARLAGISPRWTTFWVFVLIGGLAGLAAMMNSVQSPQVDPKSGTGLELKAIAAAVVGGVAVTGGRGRLWGVFFGLLLLITISPALVYLHVDAYWEKAIQGAIILLAVVTDGLRSRRA